MTEIVVTWWSGSEWTGGNMTTCLYYESTGALHLHLHEAVEKYRASQDAYYEAGRQYRSDVDPINKQIRKIKGRSKGSAQDADKLAKLEHKLTELANVYLAAGKSLVPDVANLNGVDFHCSSYLKEMPTIQTLAEWFEENRENSCVLPE